MLVLFNVDVAAVGLDAGCEFADTVRDGFVADGEVELAGCLGEVGRGWDELRGGSSRKEGGQYCCCGGCWFELHLDRDLLFLRKEFKEDK